MSDLERTGAQPDGGGVQRRNGIAVRVAPVPLWGLLAVAASRIIDPLLIWGGSKCETTSGVTGCFGYPPAGIIILGFVAFAIVAGVLELEARVRAHV